MDSVKNFELTKEDLEKRLRWYEQKYGPYIGNRGVHNWKNLFRKPTGRDLLVLFMIAMVLFAAWAYKHDVQQCRDFIENHSQTIILQADRTPVPLNLNLTKDGDTRYNNS